MSTPDFTQHIASDIRYGPAITGALILLLFLLFIDKLPEPISQWLVPSLAAYVLSAGCLGYIQAILYARKGENLSNLATGIIITSHIACVAGLVAYNVCRQVL